MRTRSNPNRIYHSSADLPSQPKSARPEPLSPRPRPAPQPVQELHRRRCAEVKQVLFAGQAVRVYHDFSTGEYTALARGKYGYVLFASASIDALTHEIKRSLSAKKD
jgi:hypothetical protein